MKSIFFLDKGYPAEHSFVDDFLSVYFCKDELLLIYQRASTNQTECSENLPENSMMATYPRRGVRRFLNVLIVFRLLQQNKKFETILVRNCPAMLLGAKLFCMVSGRRAPRLVYMSSFDHEGTARGLKRWIALRFHWILSKKVTGLLAVSDLGMSRVKALYPFASSVLVIPLCASGRVSSVQAIKPPCSQSIKTFIYGGSFNQRRKFEVVLEAFERAIVANRCELLVVGVDDELAADWISRYWFCSLPNVKILSKLPRSEFLRLLLSADFGLSLVPSSNINEEMSPTKLLEYFDHSIPAIASDNVGFQQDIISRYSAGILTKFKRTDIEIAIEQAISAPVEEYARLVAGAQNAASAFTYEAYQQPFRALCNGSVETQT